MLRRTAFAVILTIAMFRAFGAKRTRLLAQVVAAVIGAAFVIGLQIAAILSFGTLSRTSVLQSEATVARAPDIASFIWWPARAAMGDVWALVLVLVLSFILLAVAITLVAPRFGEIALTAASTGATSTSQSRRAAAFRPTSPRRALRRKEWTLLRRDPWLVSQSLMQMLYLIPPAVLLWRSFEKGGSSGAYQLLVPVLVMAAGQLAGGLAWLAISGEDAPDLVASAPVPARFILRAKIEAVLGVIAVIFAPLVVALAIASPWHALITAAGVGIATTFATRNPALVPQPSQTQPISATSGFLARGDLRRGLFLDRLGGHCSGCGRKPRPCHRARGPDAVDHRRRLVHEPPRAELICPSRRVGLL